MRKHDVVKIVRDQRSAQIARQRQRLQERLAEFQRRSRETEPDMQGVYHALAEFAQLDLTDLDIEEALL